jgi:hypothetical protein
VTTELTQAEKCGLLMVKLQSPLPNFFSPRVSAVHSGRVFRTALPDNNHENSRAAINGCAIYAG